MPVAQPGTPYARVVAFGLISPRGILKCIVEVYDDKMTFKSDYGNKAYVSGTIDFVKKKITQVKISKKNRSGLSNNLIRSILVGAALTSNDDYVIARTLEVYRATLPSDDFLA